MTLLLYDGAARDPRITRLHDGTAWAWVELVISCTRNNNDTLTLDEITTTLADDFSTRLLDDLEASQLLAREPDNHYRLLARGDLRAIDNEAD